MRTLLGCCHSASWTTGIPDEIRQIAYSYMDPDYEERRTPHSLADMLGLRDHQEDTVVLDTGTRGVRSIVAPPSRLGSGAAVETIASAGGGNSSSGNPSSSRRPPAPQQQLRYSSLLEIPDQPSRPRSAWWGGDGSHVRIGVDDFQGGGGEYEQQEDELPSYEEAISQPPENRLSVPLIAEAERQIPPLHGIRSAHHPIHASVSAQPIIPPSPAPQDSPATVHSLSRFARLLRRRHSHDYIRPPPPQEGIPLELVCDKFGNRRRDILWHGNSSGKLIWLGSLGDGGRGLPPTIGFAGRSMRWERRVLRRGCGSRFRSD
ncbi:hypothetical protein BGX38DRAFT_870778 [Terfezia claveryi]|nr:hypothetical protein BGX38DRAFT_870778 [Terfezia claveryi]